MAEEQAKEHSDVAAVPAPAKRKKVLIIGAVVSLLVGIGAPVGYFLVSGKEEIPEEKVEDVKVETTEPEQVREAIEEAPELEEGEESLGAIVPFETFLVNLVGGKYIRLQMQVEFETPDVPRKFYGRIVPIRDGIIGILTQQTAADLEDSRGKEKLKKSVREFINEQLRREDVRRVYFTQFVIQ